MHLQFFHMNAKQLRSTSRKLLQIAHLQKIIKTRPKWRRESYLHGHISVNLKNYFFNIYVYKGVSFFFFYENIISLPNFILLHYIIPPPLLPTLRLSQPPPPPPPLSPLQTRHPTSTFSSFIPSLLIPLRSSHSDEDILLIKNTIIVFQP